MKLVASFSRTVLLMIPLERLYGVSVNAHALNNDPVVPRGGWVGATKSFSGRRM